MVIIHTRVNNFKDFGFNSSEASFKMKSWKIDFDRFSSQPFNFIFLQFYNTLSSQLSYLKHL